MAGDASAMPTSISISTLATLKTWIDIVQQSREAGISVTTKGSQLWHVGAGLPLDALKKGSIVDWACSYTLEKAEVPPLLDALIKNTSLGRLNLAESGLTWDASGSASPLVDAMKSSSSALSGLEVLVLSKESGCELPIAELRAGPERAFAALENLNFYTPRGGAWFTDIMVCGDLLRTSPNQRSLTRLEREMEVEVVRVLEQAHAGDLSREDWEKVTKRLMAAGALRRSALRCLVGAEVLRDVGHSATDLKRVGFSLLELRKGRFTVMQMRESGVSVQELFETRYSSEELYQGGVGAAELKPLGFLPDVMRVGGFSATEMRAAKYAGLGRGRGRG